MNTNKQLILSFILGVLLGALWITHNNTHSGITNTQTTASGSSVPSISTQTGLSVTPKDSPEAPDLAVNQKYVATLNNKKVEVPITNVQAQGNTTSASPTSATPYTATVQQEVDITPLVNLMVPRWELGVGLGRHEGDTYIPVSVQRNYTYKKAIQIELHIDPRNQKVSGVEIQHKWRF
jgi:hypothetical protein